MNIRQKFAYTLLGAGIILVGTIISPLTANDADPDAREVILFHGLPIVKLQADGTAENPHRLESMLEHQKKEYECVIVKKGDKYFWKSRNNRELKKKEGGIYITFRRVDGAPDYVRIINPAWANVAVAVGDYTYMEHFAHTMTTLTYWGQHIKNTVND